MLQLSIFPMRQSRQNLILRVVCWMDHVKHLLTGKENAVGALHGLTVWETGMHLFL